MKYPREPVGSVWLIRQPDGAKPEVVAFTAECPHLGCAVNLAADGKSFLCPCHTSAFTFDGQAAERDPPAADGPARGRALGRSRPGGPRQVPAVPDRDRGEEPPCLTQLADWLDDRTGYRALVHEALDEPIPGGAAGGTSSGRR